MTYSRGRHERGRLSGVGGGGGGGWCGVCEGKERTTFNVLILACGSEPYWGPCHLVSSSMWTHELGSLQYYVDQSPPH